MSPPPSPLLDPPAVARLLPHRPPLLLVDTVEGFDAAAGTLIAHYRIPEDHPVFAGHFPGRPLWPGVYTIEGLAQSAGLLLGLLHPDDQAPASPLLASANVRLLVPVLPGQRLAYRLALIQRLGAVALCRASATVDEVEIARGQLTLALGGG